MFRRSSPRRRAPGGLDLPASQTLGRKIARRLISLFFGLSMILSFEVLANSSGDYLSKYRGLAEKGDMQAQYYLGLRYEQGVNGQSDYATAMHWFTQAARQNHRNAAFKLGLLYQQGLGSVRDYTQAARWYRVAAEAGLSEAQFNLGYFYERGLGLPADGVQAVTWYRRAALQGMSGAYRNLGMLFAVGGVVERDDAKALFWLSLMDQSTDPAVADILRVIRARSGADVEKSAAALRQEWENANQ